MKECLEEILQESFEVIGNSSWQKSSVDFVEESWIIPRVAFQELSEKTYKEFLEKSMEEAPKEIL